MTSQTPIEIVAGFLDALARDDVAGGLEYVDDNIAYTNVSLPTVHGKRKVAGIFRRMEKSSAAGFDYRMINVSADGPVVLTERIDELRFGRVAMQFWVCGRFEIHEGRITVWRDYFDYLDFTKGIIKGLIAAVIPAVQKPLSASSIAA